VPSPIAIWAGSAAIVALLCGCTNSEGDAPAIDPPASGPSASAPPVQSEVEGEIQEAPDLEEGWEGILRDVKMTACDTEAGEVTAKGTVVNSANESRDISILISWNAPNATNSLMQLVVLEEDLPAGETAKWKVAGDLPADAGQCVLLARSGTLEAGS
jgi:hypothetical protein